MIALASLALALPAVGAPAQAQEVPNNVRSIIEKTQSLGLGRFPITFWGYTNLAQHGQYMDEAEVEEWADAGFTVPPSPEYDPTDPAQVAHIRRLLDWAQARGMKLILWDPRCYARRGEGGLPPADYADGVRAAVAQFGDHPATFGFLVGDEPGAEDKESFFACYRTQKEIAPHLHPLANLLPYFPGIEQRAGTDTWPNYLDEYVRKSNADFICYDCYAQMNPGEAGWHAYFENLRLYREAALRNGVPFWNTLLSVGHFRYRCPDYNDLRWQFNTTIACGAHGVAWFFYYMREPHDNYRLAPVDQNWDRTPAYYDLRRVQKDFHRFYGDLFTRLVCTRVMFYPDAFGEGLPFTPDGIISRVQPDRENHPVVVSEFVDAQGGRYAMLVNNSTTESVNVGLTFPGADVRVFSWNWSGQEVEGGAYCASGPTRDENGLSIRHWLAPGQEAVYRVESAAAAAEPIGGG